MYVWAALLASVLLLIGGGVGLVFGLLQQLFSAHPRLSDQANLVFGHYLGVSIVAAAVAFYHWRVLRADAAARPPKLIAVAPIAPAPSAVPAAEPDVEVVDAHARRYTLVVTDATEDDIHQALAELPPHASYKLTATEEPAALDGH
jgi:hypothetical protein